MISRLASLKQRYFPGLCLTAIISIAALFVSQRYGAPVMLMALLFGMAFNFLDKDSVCTPGIDLSATFLLRMGVALLGLRISFADVISLGWLSVVMVCIAVFLTIIFGLVVGRIMGFSRQFGVLTAGSVAICGASAAMAICSVLPPGEKTHRDTLFTIIAVTTLSTVAMVLYPLISSGLNLSPQAAGMFLGATIHDVAQVVGAGYSVSEEVGTLSTFVKLLRISMLVPVVLIIGMFISHSLSGTRKTNIAMPGFLIAFVILFLINSLVPVPTYIHSSVSNISGLLLTTAIAALGVKTSLEKIMTVGLRSVMLVVSETVFIALLVLCYVIIYM